MERKAVRNESVFQLAWDFTLRSRTPQKQSDEQIIDVIYQMIRAAEGPCTTAISIRGRRSRIIVTCLKCSETSSCAGADAMKKHLLSVDERLGESLKEKNSGGNVIESGSGRKRQRSRDSLEGQSTQN